METAAHPRSLFKPRTFGIISVTLTSSASVRAGVVKSSRYATSTNLMETFTFFWDGPFSQWHPSTFRLDGDRYNCAEQFMMAEKARYFMDDDALSAIMRADHPRDQKQIGRRISGFDESEWQHTESNGKPYCWNIVFRGNIAKFSQNPKLRATLMRTVGTTLVEASPLDTIWGIGLAADDSRAHERATWQGTNWLGEVLSAVREQLAEPDTTVA